MSYEYSWYITFCDYTAREFARDVIVRNKLFGRQVITNCDTIDMLTTRMRALRPVRDSLKPNIDTRMMAVFYGDTCTDTLYLGPLRGHDLQLNNLTMKSDSCLWQNIRDAVLLRDKRFYDVFHDKWGL